jgi:hypothetical protein
VKAKKTAMIFFFELVANGLKLNPKKNQVIII